MFADVYLNDQAILHADNMFRPLAHPGEGGAEARAEHAASRLSIRRSRRCFPT